MDITSIVANQTPIDDVIRYVLTHLIAQGRPAARADTHSCVYRAANDRTCAIGCLIDAEHYAARIEGEGARAAIRLAYGADGYSWAGEHEHTLRLLQRMHDSFADSTNDMTPVSLRAWVEDKRPGHGCAELDRISDVLASLEDPA